MRPWCVTPVCFHEDIRGALDQLRNTTQFVYSWYHTLDMAADALHSYLTPWTIHPFLITFSPDCLSCTYHSTVWCMPFVRPSLGWCCTWHSRTQTVGHRYCRCRVQQKISAYKSSMRGGHPYMINNKAGYLFENMGCSLKMLLTSYCSYTLHTKWVLPGKFQLSKRFCWQKGLRRCDWWHRVRPKILGKNRQGQNSHKRTYQRFFEAASQGFWNWWSYFTGVRHFTSIVWIFTNTQHTSFFS